MLPLILGLLRVLASTPGRVSLLFQSQQMGACKHPSQVGLGMSLVPGFCHHSAVWGRHQGGGAATTSGQAPQKQSRTKEVLSGGT